MLFQCLCGFQPIFYSTHPNEEPIYLALGGESTKGKHMEMKGTSIREEENHVRYHFRTRFRWSNWSNR